MTKYNLFKYQNNKAPCLYITYRMDKYSIIGLFLVLKAKKNK